MLVYSGPIVRAAVLDQAKQMGVDVIRVQFVWRNIALQKPTNPSDPAAYGNAWSNWDSLVIEAHKRGMKVLATITGPAPTWDGGTTGQVLHGLALPEREGVRPVRRRGRPPLLRAGRRRPRVRIELSRPRSHVHAGAAAHHLRPGRQPGRSDATAAAAAPDGGGGGEPPPPPPPTTAAATSRRRHRPARASPTPPPPPGTTLPRIDMWSIYNEPNHPLFLSPQRHKGVLTAPSLYRALYRAGWKALARRATAATRS